MEALTSVLLIHCNAGIIEHIVQLRVDNQKNNRTEDGEKNKMKQKKTLKLSFCLRDEIGKIYNGKCFEKNNSLMCLI